jgi:tripartite-type tricarboxylate transporter receptor subunit TctC
MRLISALCGISIGVIALANSPAQAQAPYPSKPVHLIVPFAAGGPSDVICRVVASALSEKWGQPVIVDSKPGAGTIIGSTFVAQAAPDGYTIGFALPPLSLNQALRTKISYDVYKDFTYLTQITKARVVILANKDFKPNTLAELIAEGKRLSAAIDYASPGPGTAQHLIGQLIASQAGITLQHIPYNGSAPALTDVIAGRVPLMIDVWSSARPHVEAGKLKVLALANETRMPGYDYPTVGETMPSVVLGDPWSGMIAPAGLPPEVTSKLVADINEALRKPAVEERLRGLGSEPWGTNPEQFRRAVIAELELWKKVGVEANVKLD